jgi:hypothetical protein
MITLAGEYLIAHKHGTAGKIDVSKVKTIVVDKKNVSQFPDGSMLYNENGELIELEIMK